MAKGYRNKVLLKNLKSEVIHHQSYICHVLYRRIYDLRFGHTIYSAFGVRQQPSYQEATAPFRYLLGVIPVIFLKTV